ncbi:MAG: hypothetical protein IH614_03455, partial [Desulfuromonadales bacterium]|nr:hypothetical protein [Desulfuromonadales bacterium]
MSVWRSPSILPVLFLLLTGAAEAAPPSRVLAADLLQTLATASDHTELPVIIRWGEKAALPPGAAGHQKEHRRRMIKALKATAERTQQQARAYLRSQGARRLHPLWAINALAVTARADTLR